MDLVTYRIRHTTEYRYEAPVAIAHNEAHLAPRDTPFQHAVATRFAVEPQPGTIARQRDYFGNWLHRFSLEEPHQSFRITSSSRVTVQPAPEREMGESWPIEAVVEHLKSSTDSDAIEAFEMSFDSPLVQWDQGIRSYASASFPKGTPVLSGAWDLTHRIYRDFRYQPGVTTVSTPVSDVFRARRGVCQDFAHFQIACLRSLGLSARYISGYLLTRPVPGTPKMVGADESHAWVSVYCPHFGFVDLDPTNDAIVSHEHTTVAWGRDYGDVTPLRGVVLGGGTHSVEVSVDMSPVAPGDPPA